ncbi:hypothetical protein K9M48_00435 [Candidatus Gracilibacteria bacterium]|nr:hypothetical protein [Candidatus Gracilibacteria bacterium]
MSEIRIRKSIVEKYIQKFAKKIQHMDGKVLPAVMLELQAEEGSLRNVNNYKKIIKFSEVTLQSVFFCWFSNGSGNTWFRRMKAEEEKLRLSVKK